LSQLTNDITLSVIINGGCDVTSLIYLWL